MQFLYVKEVIVKFHHTVQIYNINILKKNQWRKLYLFFQTQTINIMGKSWDADRYVPRGSKKNSPTLYTSVDCGGINGLTIKRGSTSLHRIEPKLTSLLKDDVVTYPFLIFSPTIEKVHLFGLIINSPPNPMFLLPSTLLLLMWSW